MHCNKLFKEKLFGLNKFILPMNNPPIGINHPAYRTPGRMTRWFLFFNIIVNSTTPAS